MLVNPLILAPAETPKSVTEGSLILGTVVFPALFMLVCAAMRWTRTQQTPYFAYLCAFAALGCLSLSVATANSPLSVATALVACAVCPILNTVNFLRLRSLRDLSLWHKGAQWAALLSTASVLLLLFWAALSPSPH